MNKNNTISVIEQQMNNMQTSMNMMAGFMQQMSSGFKGIQEYVQSSIQVKDKQIDDIRDLCGFKTNNVKFLSSKIKSKLEHCLKHKIWANSLEYKYIKQKIFDKYKVVRWEDIPIYKFNDVDYYINNLDFSQIVSDLKVK